MSVSDAGRRPREVATAALCLVVALVLMTACTGAAPGPVSPAATAAPADGWLTFDDPAAPFTLRYPGDAVLTHGESSAGVYTVRLQFRVPGADGYQGMLVRVEPNPEGKGLEALAAGLYRRYYAGEPPAALLAELQEAVVSGEAGVRIKAAAGEDFAILLPYGDRTYIVAPVHGMASAALDPAALDLFHRVLGTLEVRR